MNLPSKLEQFETVFIDTAPIIYYVEAHPQFGSLVETIYEQIEMQNIIAYTSVISLTEVLPKPIEQNQEELANQLINFITNNPNLTLLEISADIAEAAGRLRGKYNFLKTMDALQIATALNSSVDCFLTNDDKLRKINELEIIVLKDYLSSHLRRL